MGWDNASTVAQEVDDPQRNYPRAMLISAALVAVTYIVPLAAVGLAGVPAEQFSTGAWADAARSLVGPGLAFAVVCGGMLSGAGMFNALMLSYARVPYVAGAGWAAAEVSCAYDVCFGGARAGALGERGGVRRGVGAGAEAVVRAADFD